MTMRFFIVRWKRLCHYFENAKRPVSVFRYEKDHPRGALDLDNTLIIVFFPFLAALIIPWFAERFRKHAAWFAMTAPLVSLWALFDLYGDWAAGGRATITHAIAWVPAANVEISFMVDGLSLMWGFSGGGHGRAHRPVLALVSARTRSAWGATTAFSSRSWARCWAWCSQTT